VTLMPEKFLPPLVFLQSDLGRRADLRLVLPKISSLFSFIYYYYYDCYLSSHRKQQASHKNKTDTHYNGTYMSRLNILFDELTFALDWAWPAGRPDHVTADAWPRFGSRTVSLSVLVADSSSVVLNMLCGFLFDVRSRALHTYFVFFVNTFLYKNVTGC